jgi:hypothetical protein
MRAGNWFLMAVSLIAVGGGMIVGVNVMVDPYGLYRDTHGRRLPVYGDSRVSKYLLSARYVPDNFNAILIGSSMSANWDMTGVEKLRIYNESLDGGNSVEEKAVVEPALSRPGISVAALIVHPFFTHSHDFETVKLEPSLRFSALGSSNLLNAYNGMVRARLHRATPVMDYAGTERFDTVPPQLNAVLQGMFRPGAPFEVDPLALAAYQDVVAQLQAHHIQIIFIVPPIFEDLLRAQQTAFQDYARLIEANMAPEDLLIDFTSEEFADFRRDRANFGDGVHLFTNPAAVIVSHINARINDWIAQGRLRQPPLPR